MQMQNFTKTIRMGCEQSADDFGREGGGGIVLEWQWIHFWVTEGVVHCTVHTTVKPATPSNDKYKDDIADTVDTYI